MKVVMSIAGSDSSGGAGIQADLKTFEAFGVFGTSAITVLTAQNTQGVQGIVPVEPDFVRQQINAILEDFDVAAIKIGMLFSIEIIEVVIDALKECTMPIVFDPVFISKAGSPLLQDEAVEKMKALFPLATVITPNQFEAKSLFNYTEGMNAKDVDALGVPVLVKNHHDVTTNESVDILFQNGTEEKFTTTYVETRNLHGTGCSFSSAIAANLALGKPLNEAIRIAKSFITEGLKTAPAIGDGPGPINHKQGGLNVQ